MRRVFITSLSIVVLLYLLLVLRVSGASPLGITPTPFAFLPHVAKDHPSPPLEPTTTPAPTPGPSDTLVIVELSGHSDPEYVDVYNFGTTAQDMTGWYIVSVIGQETFYFPGGYVLNSAGFVQIESGDSALHNPPLQLLWTSQTVWNNSGDKAILYNSANKPLSSACYGIGCAQK